MIPQAYVIALPDEDISGMHNHLGGLVVHRFDAYTPANRGAFVPAWNYPETGERIIGGLRCHAYKGRNPLARQACFYSHLALWHLCAEGTEPIIVLESDAVFTRFFDPAELDNYDDHFGMISLNDPRGATRKAREYHETIQRDACDERWRDVVEIPWIDAYEVPQGLPGHSAYYILPSFARRLIDKANELGGMPNDTLACKQWFPRELGCLTSYVTKVSGRPSSLS